MENFNNINDTFLYYLSQIMYYGDDITVRGSNTKELLSVKLTINNPRQRCMFVPHRHDNIFAKIAETVWMLAGRDDITWLSYYMPRAHVFCDRGSIWRGAYGPRLRNWNSPNGKVDQLESTMKLLKDDPNTRRAVISIWDPYEDSQPSKDIPCNNWIHFFIRNDKLFMNVAQRSSDIMWGFSGIDMFSWTTLHQLMAHWVGAELGDYTHFISSFHIYDRHYSTADRILNNINIDDIYTMFNIPTLDTIMEFNGLNTILDDIFIMEQNMRERHKWFDIRSWNENDLWLMWAYMLQLYIAHKDTIPTDEFIRHLNWLPWSDMKLAAIDYMIRDKSLSLTQAYSCMDAPHAEEIGKLLAWK